MSFPVDENGIDTVKNLVADFLGPEVRALLLLNTSVDEKYSLDVKKFVLLNLQVDENEFDIVKKED